MKIEIISKIKHDGKVYSKGEKVSLADEHASRLVSLGVAKEIKTTKKNSEKENSGNEGDDNANAQGSDQ